MVIISSLGGAPSVFGAGMERDELTLDLATTASLELDGAKALDIIDADEEAPWVERLDWVVQFEPGVWFPALEADLKTPGSSGVARSQALDIDEPEAAPYGEIHIRTGDWRVTLAGFAFLVDETRSAQESFSIGAVSGAAGESVDTDLDYISLQVTAAYQFYERDFAGEDDGIAARMFAEVMGGVRTYDVDLEVSSGGATARGDEFWIEPVIGARFGIELAEQLTIDIAATAGAMPLGDHSSTSWSATAGAQWRFMDNAGVQFGFRHQFTNLEDGDGDDEFSLDGSLSGLFLSVVVRF